ncbi:unnamed protein product [Cuscuta epithymum]|uniref:DUF7866 domain-containing protein n=1 Tax=Cuscuta epithymum TaxID=186058 RepID=A0AAV0EVZ5_9ASTE|nr:unnamed protein product [Cuscuta epithymum]CAH9127423.1 unnamed protein product [Cuscuta epithymum]
MNLTPINHSKVPFLLLLFICHLVMGEVAEVAGKQLVPLKTSPEFIVDMELSGGRRRRLDPFQLCSECKCCESSEDPSTCTLTPCCFGIDCQLPNKPFGVCAFVPQSCNCTSCNTLA